jgi:type VI secretion system protein ImpL
MRVLLSRWLQTLLGTAILAGLVWEFGPLLPALQPVLPRVLVMQSMLVIWAVANALIDARRRSREAALSAGLAGDEEAAAVGGTFASALQQLKKSGQRSAVFALPWYAIIGPPGAGKTTALLNAGLEFLLKEQMGKASLAGVGGTRLCEWWFTREAVLIDTAGRYTTQDSDAEVDRAGWDAFLDLLRRTRPGQPLNGIIVAIALPEVVLANDAERDQHAATIAQRITELQQRLGVHLPIYALFTKADLIAGFSEFFDGMDRTQRDQVWGTTFAWASTHIADLAERFGAGFRSLVERLNQRLIARLQAEHRLERRGLIAGFPSQVASLEKPLAAFIGAAFAGPALAVGGASLLRGVYFASGTQEGTPIDRLTGAMARAFGIDQARAAALRPEQGRSYFLGTLLREVVFGEAMLVREAPGAARRRHLLRIAAFAALLLAVAAAAGAMLWSRAAAQAQIASVAAALAGYEQAASAVPLDPVAEADLRPVAALLDQAEALEGRIPHARIGFGMAQGEKLAAGVAAVYRNGLDYALLPRLIWRLETQMRGSLGRPDFLYEATRIYLMLGGAGPLNASQISEWMAVDWAVAYPAPEDAGLRAALQRHLHSMLAQPLPPIALDGTLVAQARASFSHGRGAIIRAGLRPADDRGHPRLLHRGGFSLLAAAGAARRDAASGGGRLGAWPPRRPCPGRGA